MSRPPVSRLLRHRAAPLVVALLALLPVLSDIQQLTRVQQVLIYAIVAFGLNIGLGYAGEFAVAQPVVLGVAAYTAAILNVETGWSSLATLPCAVVIGVAVGFVLSAPGFRLRGWYLTITTFFAAVIFPDLIQLFRGITGGSEGLAGMDPLPGLQLTLGSSPSQFEYVLGIVVVLWLAMYNIYRSSWGVVLRAVRDAPLAAESSGIAVWRVKAAVAVVSSVPVAIAGWMIAHINGVVGPNSFGLSLTIIIIAAVVLGGSGSVWGPVVGIVVVELVALWIGPFSSYNALLVGLAVLVVSALLPAGVIPAVVTVARRRLGLGRGLALAGVDVTAALPPASGGAQAEPGFGGAEHPPTLPGDHHGAPTSVSEPRVPHPTKVRPATPAEPATVSVRQMTSRTGGRSVRPTGRARSTGAPSSRTCWRSSTVSAGGVPVARDHATASTWVAIAARSRSD
jgi:ABC-type branched-subunit amino acid transport system permease subunit